MMYSNHSELLMQFDEMQAVVDGVSMGICVAELHGYQTGLLVFDLNLSAEQWWLLLQEDYPAGSNTDVDSEDQAMLYELLQLTGQSLANDELGFTLLLPADEDSLFERVIALSEWCAGFLSGIQRALTLVEPSLMTAMQENPQIHEILKDISAIWQAQALDVETTEAVQETEADFTAISEHVRIAAMTVFVEIAVSRSQTQGDAIVPTNDTVRLH